MTAVRLGKAEASRFAVVGEHSAGAAPAVRHVALLAETQELAHGKSVEVLDMGPPMHAGAAIHGPPRNRCASHVVGWLDVTEEKRKEIDLGISKWLRFMAPRSLSVRDYVAVPAYVEMIDGATPTENQGRPQQEQPTAPPPEDDGGQRVFLRRCSCAGFVERAYLRGAGVELVVPQEKLPPVQMQRLREIWQNLETTHPVVLKRIGLGGQGPWRVLLPGYLLHAFTRNPGDLPYEPDLSHACF